MPGVKNPSEFGPALRPQLIVVHQWIGLVNVWRHQDADQPFDVARKVVQRDPWLQGQCVWLSSVVVDDVGVLI